MNQLPPDLAEEAPLDPAAERVRRKMVRLMVVSMGIMFVGIFAVLAAVIWQLGEATQTRFEALDMGVPAGAQIIETDMGADAILMRVRDADGTQQLLIYDRMSGNLLRAFTLREDVDAAN